MIISSFDEMSNLAKKVASLTNSQYSKITSRKFPDGDSYIKLEKSPKNKKFVMIVSFAHEPNTKIIETLFAAKTAREYGARKIILIATYLPYMRQDARFNNYEAISAEIILPLLAHNVDELIAIDPHLHRIKKLAELSSNAHSITSNSLIANFIAKKFKDYQLVGPDEESHQWDKLIAKALNRDATILKKQRLSSYKVRITSKKLGKKILIIDDIISTGKTILETIKIAKKQGAQKIVVIGIHGLFINNCDREIKKYAELISTNTVPNAYAKIDVAPLIAENLKKN